MLLAQMVDTLFRNTLAPWQWALLAAIPPAIVALYFLKLKRQPIEVPSTYLWKKSIEDLHVNSLWQRIRQNLLMYLQLLMLALAMLALLRPGWEGTRLEGERFIFLIDNSASMQATDVEDAESRLEEAKSQVRALVDQMESGMTAMMISFADAPRVVQEFTDNRRELRERLETIQPTFATTDLKGALELADGLANPGKIIVEEEGIEVDVVDAQTATLFIFSDGRFEDVKGFSLGNLKPIYVPVGSLESQNIAITALATGRSEARPDYRQAFIQVSNFADDAQQAVVELSLDGQFVDAKSVDVEPDIPGGLVFPLADAPPGKLRAKLSYDLDSDALELDDVAYGVINDAEPGRVLVVTVGNAALETALNTERAARFANVSYMQPTALESDAFQTNAAAGEYDLVIFDACIPGEMPRANTLFLGELPPIIAWRPARPDSEVDSTELAAGESVDAPQIIDWHRAHPLLAHVELGNVLVADSLLTNPPPGGDVLIDTTSGAIAAIGPRDSFEDVAIGFPLTGADDEGNAVPKTNWPLRHGFPTFWLNVLEYLAGKSDLESAGGVRPGEAVELRIAGNVEEVTVRDPNGKDTVVRRGSGHLFTYSDTHVPGIYEIRERGEIVRRFAVNLFDGGESNVRVEPSQDPEATNLAADIKIGNVGVAAIAGRTPARKEVWRWLLIAVLCVLLVEWYVYNRRVFL